MTDEHRIPHIPIELLPLLEDCIPRVEGYVPRRRSPKELKRLRAGVEQVAQDFGFGSPAYNRSLILLAMEYARSEAIP